MYVHASTSPQAHHPERLFVDGRHGDHICLCPTNNTSTVCAQMLTFFLLMHASTPPQAHHPERLFVDGRYDHGDHICLCSDVVLAAMGWDALVSDGVEKGAFWGGSLFVTCMVAN